MPRVLMKVVLDGTEIRSAPVDVHDMQSLKNQAAEWCAEVRDGKAKLFRVLLYCNYFEDYIDASSNHVFQDKQKFCLIFTSTSIMRETSVATTAEPYRIKGSVGDTKIDVEIDRPLAAMLLAGSLVVVPAVAICVAGFAGKSSNKGALGMFGSIFKQIDNKKNN